MTESRYLPDGAPTLISRPDGLTAHRECESDAVCGGRGLGTPRTITSNGRLVLSLQTTHRPLAYRMEPTWREMCRSGFPCTS
jgi:hypothetical protein